MAEKGSTGRRQNRRQAGGQNRRENRPCAKESSEGQVAGRDCGDVGRGYFRNNGNLRNA